MSQSARLALPYLLPSQAQKHVTHNEALERLDLLVQLAVEGLAAEAPPPAPEEGEVWALAPSPTGAWSGHGGDIAIWTAGAWFFATPQEGWHIVDKSDGSLKVRSAGGWVAPTLADLDNLAGVGVNTTADTTNRLAVSSPATLLTHAGAGHQLKLNKAGVGETGSLLFQTGWSGRAEMGTAGSDDFSIKVSADGAAWHTALTIDAATGAVQMPTGQSYFSDFTVVDDGVWSVDIPWSDPARVMMWIGVDSPGQSFLVAVTGALTGASNFAEMFASPSGVLDFSTGVLTGTTGTDGHLTLSIDTGGAVPRLYLENRLGTDRAFTLATLGR